MFSLIAKAGDVSEHDMFNTFNMGVGMSLTVDKNDADRALEILTQNGEDAYIIGEIIAGENKIEIR